MNRKPTGSALTALEVEEKDYLLNRWLWHRLMDEHQEDEPELGDFWENMTRDSNLAWEIWEAFLEEVPLKLSSDQATSKQNKTSQHGIWIWIWIWTDHWSTCPCPLFGHIGILLDPKWCCRKSLFIWKKPRTSQETYMRFIKASIKHSHCHIITYCRGSQTWAHIRIPQVDLVKESAGPVPTLVSDSVCLCGVWEFACLMSSQVMELLLVWGPYFENNWLRRGAWVSG